MDLLDYHNLKTQLDFDYVNGKITFKKFKEERNRMIDEIMLRGEGKSKFAARLSKELGTNNSKTKQKIGTEQ